MGKGEQEVTQQARAELFRSLHVPGEPLVLVNVWDAGSARVVADAGAKAIATASWSVAAAHGYADGEQVPLQLALDNFKRIVAAVALPVSIDLERGYGRNPEEVSRSVTAAISAGAVGCNIEDSRADGGGLVAVSEQVKRLAAARAAADRSGLTFYINARMDLFLRTPAAQHDQGLLADALDRAAAYVDAGASGIFVPGLAEERLIERFCAGCQRPVNIIAAPGAPSLGRLAALGVARVSHGPGPYRRAMQRLEEEARAVYSTEA